jgi:putative hydrolase of the HAD superfamily
VPTKPLAPLIQMRTPRGCPSDHGTASLARVPRLILGPTRLDLDAILFDVGGTLLRLDHAHLAACASGRGHVLTEAAVARGESHARREVDRRATTRGGVQDTDADRLLGYFGAVFAGAGVSDALALALAGEVAETHRADNLWRVPLPGASAALAGLRARGFRVAAVSNADGRVASLLATAGLSQHLETILDSHLEGVEKPHPEIFHRALARLGGVAPERAAYVGDIHAIDVVGARGAGLHPILIDETGSHRDADCPRIERLEALLGEAAAASPRVT